MPDLTGRTCIVTGASAGIGAATALGLAGLGADLALVGRDEGRLATVASQCHAAGAGTVRTYQADFAVLEEVRGLADALLTDLPRIDGEYFTDGKVAPTRDYAKDPVLAARLWTDSAALVGLD